MSLMGGIMALLMGLSLTIYGNFMYQPDDVRMLVRMAETGSLSLKHEHERVRGEEHAVIELGFLVF